jgi:hypothetical protein
MLHCVLSAEDQLAATSERLFDGYPRPSFKGPLFRFRVQFGRRLGRRLRSPTAGSQSIREIPSQMPFGGQRSAAPKSARANQVIE